MNPAEIRAWNDAQRASRRAYEEQMVHVEGWCIRGCGRKAGMSRVCPPCTQKEYRARKRKKS